MSEDQDPEREEREREDEAIRKFNARVHKHMGMTAAILGLVAAGVALARMRTMFGVSPLEALGIGASAFPWVLLILGLGVFFSLGTTRIMLGIERLANLFKGKKAGE